MPAKSLAQLKLMEAAAHNAQFAKKSGVPQKVAKDYVAATPKGAKLPARVKKAKKK